MGKSSPHSMKTIAMAIQKNGRRRTARRRYGRVHPRRVRGPGRRPARAASAVHGATGYAVRLGKSARLAPGTHPSDWPLLARRRRRRRFQSSAGSLHGSTEPAAHAGPGGWARGSGDRAGPARLTAATAHGARWRPRRAETAGRCRKREARTSTPGEEEGDREQDGVDDVVVRGRACLQGDLASRRPPWRSRLGRAPAGRRRRRRPR